MCIKMDNNRSRKVFKLIMFGVNYLNSFKQQFHIHMCMIMLIIKYTLSSKTFYILEDEYEHLQRYYFLFMKNFNSNELSSSSPLPTIF